MIKIKDNKKNKDLEEYKEELRKAIGRKFRVDKVLGNDKMLIAYLIQLGMNPEWAENAACIEIIRDRIKKFLKNSKGVKIRDNEILSTKGSIKINDEGIFELGTVREILYDSKNQTGEVFYENMNELKNYEFRQISSDGVVVHEVHRFGGNGKKPKVEDFNQLVEYTRLPDKPVVQYHSVYRAGENETERTVTDYDFAYPITLEKNGMNREKTPLYFTKRYPKYTAWFDARYKNKDKFISNIFDVQAEAMNKELNSARESLVRKINGVTSLRIKMNDIYSAVIETLENSRGGKMYRYILLYNIETFIEEDPNHLFTSQEQKKIVHEAILERLSEEPLENEALKIKISKDKKKLKERLKENKDLQTILRMMVSKKSLEDEDYSLAEAFADVQARSSMIADFNQNENAFDEECDKLDAKYRLLSLQKEVMQNAVRAIPHYRKKVKNKTLQKELKHADELKKNANQENLENPGSGDER